MSRLYVNAPIQNRDYDIERSFGASLSLFTASWQAEHSSEEVIHSGVDLWNSSLSFEEKLADTADAYRAMMVGRLATKYSTSLLESRSGQTLLTDIDQEFSAWGQAAVANALDRGTVREERREVHACRRCGATLSLADAPLSNGCVTCAVDDSHVAVRNTLVMTVTAEQQAAAYEMADMPSQDAATFSEREYAINKRRYAGVSLESLGYEGEVLDTKIAIVLLALYAAEKYIADEVYMTVGRSSAHHNVGHMLGFLGDAYGDTTARLVPQPLARAPINYLNHLRDTEVITTQRLHHLIKEVLPPHLLARRNPISPQSIDDVIFSRKQA